MITQLFTTASVEISDSGEPMTAKAQHLLRQALEEAFNEATHKVCDRYGVVLENSHPVRVDQIEVTQDE